MASSRGIIVAGYALVDLSVFSCRCFWAHVTYRLLTCTLWVWCCGRSYLGVLLSATTDDKKTSKQRSICVSVFEDIFYNNDWQIITGERPPIPRSCPDSTYKEIIEKCWQPDFGQRPSIGEVVVALRICWEGSLHRYLFSTEHIVDMAVIKEAYEIETERIEYVASMNSSFSYYRDSSSTATTPRGSSFASVGTQGRGSTLPRPGGAISNKRCVLLYNIVV